jgi:hypothetical protein
MTLLSSKCWPSGLPASLNIISFIRYVDTLLVFLTTSSATSSALGSTASGLSTRSLNKPSHTLSPARYVAPVVIACMARLCPTSRGKKYEEHASMTSPRRENTNPIFAPRYAIRMFIGSVMVMPIPTAEPCKAPMVGLRQWKMLRVTRPPLHVCQHCVRLLK